MATSTGFFDKRSGSVGSLTFAQRNGKQVTYEKVTKVKNPRTRQQAEQRMIYAAAAKFGAGLRPILDHAFESVAYGQDSINYFNSKAMNGEGFILGPKRGAVGFLPEAYMVSAGTLQSNGVEVQSDLVATLPSWTVPTTSTFAAFLLRNTQYRTNDQLTIVAIMKKANAEIGDTQGYYTRVDRVAINSTNFADLADIQTENGYFKLSCTNASKKIDVLFTENDSIAGIAMISSRNDEDDVKYKRSTEYMFCVNNGTEAAETWNETAVLSYMNSGRSMQSNRYLNGG